MATEFFLYDNQLQYTDPIPQREMTMAPKSTAILTAKELLNSPELHVWLNKLRALLILPDDFNDYHALCTQVIENFAEFVQQLPATDNGYHTQQSGMLEHALERTCIATTYCRQYLIPDAEEQHQLSEIQALWMYVVFTSALFHRLGQLMDKLDITVYQANKENLHRWEPITGPMDQTGACYYDYQFLADNDEYLGHAFTRFFARQLMPTQGFNWIAKDHKVFKVWLALLEDEWQYSGSFCGFIPRAQLEAIMNHFNKKKQQKLAASSFQELRQAKKSAPTGEAAPSLDQAEAGIAFLKWLQKNIQQQSKSIAVNKDNSSVVQVIKEGVLLTFPKLIDTIKEFQANADNKKFNALAWKDVLNQFIQLGITKADANNNHIRQIKLGTGDKMSIIKTVLVRDPLTIFIEGIPPECKLPYYALINPKMDLSNVVPAPEIKEMLNPHQLPPGTT